MKTIQGPGIFLAQFVAKEAPFNSLEAIAGWAAGLGFRGVQIPNFDRSLFDLETAATSTGYCSEITGMLSENGLAITELSTHLQARFLIACICTRSGGPGLDFERPGIMNHEGRHPPGFLTT